jgi:hypothetical protein
MMHLLSSKNLYKIISHFFKLRFSQPFITFKDEGNIQITLPKLKFIDFLSTNYLTHNTNLGGAR